MQKKTDKLIVKKALINSNILCVVAFFFEFLNYITVILSGILGSNIQSLLIFNLIC